jgi:hypothetical protein
MLRAKLFAILCLCILLAGCTKALDTTALEQRAISSAEASALHRLERIAAADVPESQEARWIAETWRDRAERENYEQVRPVFLAWAQHQPEEAEAIERTLRTWRDRLDAYGR